jgi:hypothetical protein
MIAVLSLSVAGLVSVDIRSTQWVQMPTLEASRGTWITNPQFKG